MVPLLPYLVSPDTLSQPEIFLQTEMLLRTFSIFCSRLRQLRTWWGRLSTDNFSVSLCTVSAQELSILTD